MPIPCPSCQRVVDPGLVCPHCGANLPLEPEPQMTEPAQAPAPRNDEGARLTKVGDNMTLLITLPIVGYVVWGIGGLVVGAVVGYLIRSSRRT
jgi:hypothetical protein